jgi:hypothetical protein
MKHLQSPGLRRAGALVIATAITSTTLLATAIPAQAHPAGDRAVAAGSAWLTAELTDGFLIGQYGPEYGPSVDAGLSLAEAGNGDGVAAIDTALQADINNYIAGEAFGDTGSTYAGATGKAATFAFVADADPRSYGGVDLISRLEAVVSTAEPTEGRVVDKSIYGDYVNVLSQSFAARALTTAGSDLADEATTFLLEQQCGAGFFRFGLTKDKTSPRQGCRTGAADSASDLDATSTAVINLLATPDPSPSDVAAARSGASWLETQQSPDGSFGAGNANTTGLAGWALGEAGKASAARAAASWLRGVQVADLAPCVTTLAAENGAIAPSQAALAETRTSGGIASGQRISYGYATAQALPALAYAPEGGGALGIAAPVSAVEISTVTVAVTGLGAGEPACVSFGSQARQVTGTGAVSNVTFQLPAGVATHTFRLTTLGGSTTAATSSTATPTATPTPAPQVGALTTRRVVKVTRNRFAVSVTCEGTTACAGKLKVRTARKVEMRSGKRVVTVAKREYAVAAGEERRLVVKLTKAGRLVLADGKVKVKAVQKAPGAERAVTSFWLKRA